MHASVLDFVERMLTAADVAGKRVLEVGSYDVNGSARPYIESLCPAEYLGVDASSGPRVDRVVDCVHLVDEVGSDWDIVVSTEMLEHVRDWQACVTQLTAAVAPDGLLLVTTRSPGFQYHPYPEDHWRYTTEVMSQILDALNLDCLKLEDDSQAPGVFVLASKPPVWRPHPELLDDVAIEGVHKDA